MTTSIALLSRWTLGLACAGALALAACSSAPTDEGDWSRVFAYPFEEVWSAALRALENEGFALGDLDRDRGRILADAGAGGLELRLRARGELVTVQVLGMGTMGRPVRTDRLGEQVSAVLEEVSRILRER